MRQLFVAAAGLLVTLSKLPAQSSTANTLPTGTPVRVGVPLREGQRVTRMRKYQGTIVRHTPGMLTISIEKSLCPMICDSESMELNLATDSVAYVEIPIGRSRWRGALRGALIGAVSGVVLFQGVGIDCNELGHGADCLSDGRRPSQAQYLAEGASVFAAVGAAIGWMMGVVNWEQVDFRAGPIAATHGVALAITLRP